MVEEKKTPFAVRVLERKVATQHMFVCNDEPTLSVELSGLGEKLGELPGELVLVKDDPHGSPVMRMSMDGSTGTKCIIPAKKDTMTIVLSSTFKPSGPPFNVGWRCGETWATLTPLSP